MIKYFNTHRTADNRSWMIKLVPLLFKHHFLKDAVEDQDVYILEEGSSLSPERSLIPPS